MPTSGGTAHAGMTHATVWIVAFIYLVKSRAAILHQNLPKKSTISACGLGQRAVPSGESAGTDERETQGRRESAEGEEMTKHPASKIMDGLNDALNGDFAAVHERHVCAPLDATEAMVDAALSVDWCNEDERATVHNIWHAMLAEVPALPDTPPAADLMERMAKALFEIVWSDAATTEGRDSDGERHVHLDITLSEWEGARSVLADYKARGGNA